LHNYVGHNAYTSTRKNDDSISKKRHLAHMMHIAAVWLTQ